MFNLDKLKNILKKDKEIFLATTEQDPLVIMSWQRYQELRGDDQIVSKTNQELFNDQYVQEVKNTIFPDREKN